jgi:hypothetical protein
MFEITVMTWEIKFVKGMCACEQTFSAHVLTPVPERHVGKQVCREGCSVLNNRLMTCGTTVLVRGVCLQKCDREVWDIISQCHIQNFHSIMAFQ